MDEKDLLIIQLKNKIERLEKREFTLEELKEIAKNMGYNVLPKKQWTKKFPCTCGNKRFEFRHGVYGVFVKCPKCGKRGPDSTNENNANIAWNEMITKELNNK